MPGKRKGAKAKKKRKGGAASRYSYSDFLSGRKSKRKGGGIKKWLGIGAGVAGLGATAYGGYAAWKHPLTQWSMGNFGKR